MTELFVVGPINTGRFFPPETFREGILQNANLFKFASYDEMSVSGVLIFRIVYNNCTTMYLGKE